MYVLVLVPYGSMSLPYLLRPLLVGMSDIAVDVMRLNGGSKTYSAHETGPTGSEGNEEVV